MLKEKLSILKEKLKKLREKPIINSIINNRLRFFKGLTFFILLAFVGFLIFFSYIQITNYGLDSLNLAPVGDFNQQFIHLDFPPLGPTNTLSEINGSNNMPLCSIDLSLQYYGPLVEGTPVDIAAVGFIYPNGQKIIHSVAGNNGVIPYAARVGFEGASVYDESVVPINGAQVNFVGGQFYVPLNEETGYKRVKSDYPATKIPLKPVYQKIFWSVQGDYDPFVVIGFKNETGFSTIMYPDIRVHVDSIEVKKQENYSKISTWLTIALLLFTLLTAGSLLWELSPVWLRKLVGAQYDSEQSHKETPNKPKTDSDSHEHPTIIHKESSEGQKGDQQKRKR